MIDKNNACFSKILPFLKGFNWLCKKGIQVYLTFICILSYVIDLMSLVNLRYFPEHKNLSLDRCLGEKAWIPYLVHLICFLGWGLLLYRTWRQRITWKIVLLHVAILILLWIGFGLAEDPVFDTCSG